MKTRHRVQTVDELVQSISLHTPIPLALNGTIWPFFILYSIWLYFWVFVYGLDDYYEAGLIVLVAIACIQIFTCLCCFWSVHIQTFLNCRKAKTPTDAVLVKVVPTENNGSSELVKIQHTKIDGQLVDWFSFQKLKYQWNPDKKEFKATEFPINELYRKYFEAKGVEDDETLQLSEQKYGKNSMEMVVPEFHQLFIERATAPFFVFQIFSVGLWCLDEYWYYSLFTLFMLVVFECTLVQQQLRNMSEIRKMGNKPYSISVYRNRKWRPIQSNEIVPGDLVSIVRSQNDNFVPCDILLLRGNCIVDESMLTGESVPQMKESLENLDNLDKELDAEGDGKLFVMFGGTKVVQHTAPSKGAMRAPDSGCIGYVLRTGFNTSQGKLLRTILFGVKRVTENSLETFAFILFLLVFAVAAATYVWIKGSENPDRNRYKLFLECTLILTSIIPPDLPIELSLAVNSSLLQLSKLFVYCTEPFRIPFAGKVQICCFDKTGTLTSDNLVVEGVAGLDDSNITAICDLPEQTVQVLATCHSLAQLDDGLVGDPLEKATITAIDWVVTKLDSVVPKKGKFKGLKIVQRFHFSSSLKRMSVLAGYLVPYTNESFFIGTVKGAPETLIKMLKVVPDNYEKIYLEYSRRGARVLALGIKEFGKLDHQALREIKREDVEKDLTFVGFVIISCPVKPDSKNVIKEIIQASHKVVMITGDNPLTACHVARELRFTRKPLLVLTQLDKLDWEWVSINGDVRLGMHDHPNIRDVLKTYDFCVTGEGIQFLNEEEHDYMLKLLPFVTVFARFAPKQKEFVITTLKRQGYYTLMCGDGTNDVQALKHANVGVSILSSAPLKPPSERKKDREETLEKIEKIRRPPAITDADRNLSPRERALKHQRQKLAESQEQLKKALSEIDDESMKVVKLGDASIAAPFTSRLSSIMCVCHIIKQGRCTLVTTLQMFKILALNALISAYCQSVLYIDGIKFSDTQATLQGLFLAACFLFITRSKPLKVLSKQAPLPNIFNIYSVSTILGQFAVHFTALLYLSGEAALRAGPRDTAIKLNIDMTPEELTALEFVPNIINSTVYLICMGLQVSTFAVNYKGHPFMESLRENRLLLYSILASSGVVMCLALNLIPDVQAAFQIIDFPDDFRKILIFVLLADVAMAFLVDKICSFLFEHRRKFDLIT